MTVTLTKKHTALLNKIASYVCQAVIYIQQQQPELLLDKYRSISWLDNSNQSRLKAKLIEVIGDVQDWESLVDKIEVFIRALLISDLTNTPVLIKLQEKIRQLNPHISESNNSSHQQDVTQTVNNSDTQTSDTIDSEKQKSNAKTIELNPSENRRDQNSTESTQQDSLATSNQLKDSEKDKHANIEEIESLSPQTELNTSGEQISVNSVEEQIASKSEIKPQTGIVALLLDAENIQITPETEQFLTNFFPSSIQIKIAFANWQSMGEKDIELHNRGYDLVHVPCGKDNIDEKIIAFGSKIDEYNPKVKEILIFSSDRVTTNLSNNLKNKELNIYQISQEGSNLSIFNPKKNETNTHIVLPSIEKILSQIKDIIKEQESQTLNQWIKLSKICKIFKEKYSFAINEVVSHHLPGKNVKNIFVNRPEFVLHQIAEHSEVFLTLFKMPIQENLDAQSFTFDTKSQLEEALVENITQLLIENSENYIPVHIISERFNKDYGKAIETILNQLSINGNFVNFLESCSLFDLKKVDNVWQVALKLPIPKQ